MRARKYLAVVAAMVVGALGLTACGGSDGGGASGDGKVTLTLWHNATTGPGRAMMEKAARDFSAANPNVTIKIQVLQNEDLDGKLQTALNAGNPPDVFMQRGGGKMAAMVKAGQLMELQDSIADAKKVLPAAAWGPQTIDGKIYAVPVSIAPGGFFYSKDLFAKAGITQNPTTLAELQAAVDKLKAAKIQPIALGAKDAWPAAHYYYFFALRRCSSDTLTQAAKTLTFDDPCWLQAGQDLKNFADTKPFNQGFLTTSAQQGAGSSAGMIANHQAGMELMGSWDPGQIASLTPDQKPLPDLGWFPFPSIEGGQGAPGSMLGGVDGFSCSVKAPQKECTAFLNYLVSTPVQKEFYKAFNAIPVNPEAQAAITEPYLKQILEAYNKAPFVSQWLDTNYGQNVGNALNTSVVNMLAGKGDPQGIVDAVKTAAKKG